MISATPAVSQPPVEAFDPATYGFELNNREIAALVYLGLALVALLFWKTGRAGLFGVVKAFFQPKLTMIFVAMSLYVGACVAVLAALNVWAWSNLKTTLLWWITAGFASVFKANQISEESNAVRRLFREILTWTTIITFISEVHSLPLLAELVLLLFLIFVSMMLGVAQAGKEHAVLVGPLTWVLAVAGLFLFAYSVRGILEAPADFLEWHQLREFAVPLLLSLMFLPFVVGLAALMTYETTFTSLGFRVEDKPLLRHARRRAMLAFGWDTDGVKRLTRDIHMRDIVDREGVDLAIAEIKRLKQVEKNPPPVAAEAGWSPYSAAHFLSGHGIVTRDYHRSFDNWWRRRPRRSSETGSSRTGYLTTFPGQNRLRHAYGLSWTSPLTTTRPPLIVRTMSVLRRCYGWRSARRMFKRSWTSLSPSIRRRSRWTASP